MAGHTRMLYIFPRIVDTVIQNTTENEIARSLGKLGYSVSTLVAYEHEQTPLDGFSSVEYIHKPRSGIWATLRYHWALLMRMLAADADVILVHYPAMHLLLLARLLRIGMRHKPLWIMDIRSVPVDVEKGMRGRIIQFRYRLGIFLANYLCDGVTVITPALAETVVPLLTRIPLIGIWESGVTLEHFRRDDGDLRKELGLEGAVVLMYHGVMSPNRGLGDLVLAIASLIPRYPSLRLLLVGDGSGRAELEQLVLEQSMGDVVRFVDAVPYRQIGRYIATADVGVLPFPNIEWWAVSSPIKLMEYLAMGLPVIATDIRAIRHVVNRTGGAILAEDNDPKSLAQAITAYLVNGCQSAEHDILEETISWNAQARALDRYIEVLSRPGSHDL